MKKLLSIFFALAMLISLVPTVFAADTVAEAEAGIKVVYDFYNADLAALEKNVEFQLNQLSYAASKGFWQYADNSDNSRTYIKTNGGTGFRADSGYIKIVARNENIAAGTSGHEYWVAFKLNVPMPGKYQVKIKANAASSATNMWIESYIFKADSVTDVADGVKTNNRMRDVSKKFSADGVDEEHIIGSKEFVEAGEYYFVFMPSTNRTSSGQPKTGGYVFLKSLTLTEDGTGEALVPIISSLTATENEGVTTVEAKAMLMSDAVTSAEDATITYAVADDDAALASVNESTGVVTGLEDGTATIIATATKDGLSSSKSIEVAVTAPAAEPEEDEALSDAFEVTEKPEENYSEPSVITVSVNDADIDSVKNSNGTHTITAPETNGEGKNFLYWAKGLTAQKKIISFSNVLSDYVPDAKYANYLIAVYEGEEPKASEYYNANGQLVGTKTEPDLPSMAGYGEAKEWKQFGETNIHVAQYELEVPEKNIAITVNNGTGTGTYAYGDTVSCTANGSGTFKCWTKSDINGETEIVSCDETYIFKAWEGCTVTAIYEDYTYKGNTAKIIIDSFIAGAETGVMAEFIGFDSAVEKGIMFTDSNKNVTRIAMTTKDNQFTVIADKNGTYNGYAIVKGEGESYTLITDGSYEHTK